MAFLLTAVQKHVETRVVTGDEAFNEALLKEPPTPWSRGQLMIYLFSLVAFFNSTVNGYDGSLINNLLQNPSFIAKYNGSNSGIWAGIVSSMYQIGNIVALPFLGPVCDHFGRRAGMASGSAIIIIGAFNAGARRGCVTPALLTRNQAPSFRELVMQPVSSWEVAFSSDLEYRW